MTRAIQLFLHSVLFIGTLDLYAASACVQPTTCRAEGHHTILNADFPFSEDYSEVDTSPVGNVTIFGPDFNWTRLTAGCVALGEYNLKTNDPFHVRLLAYVQLTETNLAVGGEYEIQLRIDGVQYGWYVRAYRGQVPQGDRFGAIAQNIPAGNHKYEVWARVLDPGYITFRQQLATSMGSPTNFPYGGTVTGSQMVVDSLWRPVTNNVSFQNSTGGALDLYYMAYFQFDAGTPGDELEVKVTLNDATQRTTKVIVPPNFRDGINVFDHWSNMLPPSITPPPVNNVRLYVRNISGHTTTISNRALHLASYPRSSGSTGNPLAEASASDASLVTVDPTPPVPPAEQPGLDPNGVCGKWTKLLDFNVPGTTGDRNWTGDGYIRLLGNRQGDWSTTRIEILVEAMHLENPPVHSEMHWFASSAPNSKGEVYFFIDSMLWGNLYGQRMRLWIRKVAGCGYSDGTFDVGQRFLSVKLVPTTDLACYYN